MGVDVCDDSRTRGDRKLCDQALHPKQDTDCYGIGTRERSHPSQSSYYHGHGYQHDPIESESKFTNFTKSTIERY